MKKFIVFEGIDRSGKGTQIELLNNYLSKTYKTSVIREPGTSSLGEQVRNILLNENSVINNKAELFLYLAARAQFVDEILKKELTNSEIVISDRYFHSTIAYQGYGRGLDLKFLMDVNRFAIDGVKPDLVFYLDIDYEESVLRSDSEFDRMEKNGKEFFDKVRNGYLKMVETDSKLIYINAMGTKENIFKNVLKEIKSRNII